jgi:fructokinase
VLLSFDPNLRLDVVDDRASYLGRVVRALEIADLVKLSEVDLATHRAEGPAAAAALAAHDARRRATILTGGPRGAALLRGPRQAIDVAGLPVVVRDTVGAGDAAMAAVLFALAERDALTAERVAELDDATWYEVLTVATVAGGMACERPGADPPRLAELRERLRDG